jgi:hypothetical protein
LLRREADVPPRSSDHVRLVGKSWITVTVLDCTKFFNTIERMRSISESPTNLARIRTASRGGLSALSL